MPHSIKTEFIEEIKRVASVISSQFGDITRNIQWYSTLVIAEIAGVAKLTSTATSWSFPFFIIALIFSFASIITLIYSNIKAQDIKLTLESNFTKLISNASKFDMDTPEMQLDTKSMQGDLQQFYDTAQQSDPQVFSRIGLFCFLIASIFGGLGIVFS